MKHKDYWEKIKATAICCLGMFVSLWTTVLHYTTRVNKLFFQFEISHEHISDYSVSIIQTKISTTLQEYRIINWSFLFLVLLGILLIILVYRLNHYPEDERSSCDSDEDARNCNMPSD